jgi:hypothetical protein
MPRNSIDAPPRQANSQTSISNAALGFRSGIFASNDWSEIFFILHLSDSPLYQFLYQRSWQFLVDREANGSVAGSEPFSSFSNALTIKAVGNKLQ